jgi:ABC-type uncharacterized transport system involved in gliding motility auxiliary subunit
MRRLTDAAFYLGLLCLAAAVAQQFALPAYGRFWWPLVIAGIVLVVLSALPWLGERRRVLGARSVRYGLNAALSIVLVVGVIGFVEAISVRHSLRADLTETKRHSLSPQTIELLRNLKTDVNAVGFFRSDQPGKRVAEDLFKQYASYADGTFTWKVVDPDRDPTLARRYGVEAYGTIVLETKARSEKINDAEEEKLTNGLVKLTREGKRVVYVLQGHGERELGNTDRPGFAEAKTALERANYEVKPLALAREGKIPGDAAVIVVPGPRTDLFPPEVDALDGYLAGGGKVLAMVDPPFPGKMQDATMKRLLGRWGVTLVDDLIVELSPIGRLFGIGPEVPIIQQYEPHAITRDLGGITTLFPITRSLDPTKPAPPGVTVTPLARTSPDSWGETDRQALEQGSAKPDPQDPRGPLTVALVATKDKARLVVYGTSNLAANQFLNLQGNRDFFLNTVSWLAEEEDQITVRPKDSRQAPIFLTARQGQLLFWLPVVVLPGIVLAGGVIAVVRRRAAK